MQYANIVTLLMELRPRSRIIKKEMFLRLYEDGRSWIRKPPIEFPKKY